MSAPCPRLVFFKLFKVCCNNLMHPFVAEFTFLNRKDKSLKLHPFLMCEGTDNRENMTLGQLTQQIKLLDGSKIKQAGAELCQAQHSLKGPNHFNEIFDI